MNEHSGTVTEESAKQDTVGRCVLIVDDDPWFVDVVQEMLTPAGYRILTASSGAKGVSLAMSEKPDVILLDLMMQAVDEGLHVARVLRQIPATRDIPILLASGLSMSMHLDVGPDSEWLPVDAVVEKPVGRKELLDIIARLASRNVHPKD